MLKNNNSEILRRLTMRSLKSGKMRNIFIIITVALSATLISGLAGFAAAYDKAEEQELETMPQVVYRDISDEQIESLRNDERTEDMILYKLGSVMEIENYIIRASYYSEDGENIKYVRSLITEGSYPEKIDEAAVSKVYMRKIGKEPVIGTEISVTWLDGNTETYTVTGFTDTESESGFDIMLSEEYAQNGAELKNLNYTAAVRIVGADDMDDQTFLNEIRSMGERYGIPRHQIGENSLFATRLSGLSTDEKLFTVVTSVAVLFVSVFVIYSIFYISVTGRIRQFGQLRMIGMTSVQIRKTVRYEGIFLSIVGALIGILTGTVFAYFIIPKGFYFPNTVKIWILTIFANTITVMFSVRKPAKIAAAASPIEAAKMNDYIGEIKGKVHGKRKLTPFGLAKISSDSNRKKSAMTAVSLGIGGVLFITGATLLASFNREEYSRQMHYYFGDYVLSISRNAVQTVEHGIADIQLTNPFPRELDEEIAALEGVKKITRWERFDVTFEYNNYQTNDAVMPFDRDETDIFEQCRKEGEVFDYDRMVQNKDIIVSDNFVAKEIYGWEFKTGDKVRFRWYDGENYREDYFTVAGDVENIYKINDESAKLFIIHTGWFFMPEELLKTMVPEGYDFSDGLIISVNDYQNDTIVKEFLENYADENPYLSMYKFTDELKNDELSYTSLQVFIFGLSAFIIGFALINLVNTLVSNAMARKREFAMLCSIGMSGAQLRKMIIGEGLILAVKNIVITVIFGTAAGYVLIQTMRERAATYLHWHFPVWYLAGYAVLVVVVPVIISGIILIIMRRRTLVERLRETE